MPGNFAASTRVQQVDNNFVGGNLPLIRGLGWRRDGQGGAGAPKTLDLTITMSHADYAAVSSTFASNYKDPPQTVFTRKPVNLPDWNLTSPITPPPMDAVVPLDVPFFYNGQDALLWDVQTDNNPASAYLQDWQNGALAHTYGQLPFDTGPGCVTPNGTMNHRLALRADLSTFEMGWRVSGAPSSTPVSMLLGLLPANASLPGLCANLLTQPLVTVPMGTADANGDIALSFPINLPWLQNYASVPFHTQAFAVDPSQPGLQFALSNGLSSMSPAVAGPGALNVKRIYHTSSSTAPVGTGPADSACPTLYAY